MKLTKEQQKVIRDFIEGTGFEIWNAGCTHRMAINSSFEENDIVVCEYHEPRFPVSTYKTIQGAVNFLIKQDEEL